MALQWVYKSSALVLGAKDLLWSSGEQQGLQPVTGMGPFQQQLLLPTRAVWQATPPHKFEWKGENDVSRMCLRSSTCQNWNPFCKVVYDMYIYIYTQMYVYTYTCIYTYIHRL